MRKKIAIGFRLIVVALVITVVVAWFMPPAEPPVRVGMNIAEVEHTLGKPSKGGRLHDRRLIYPPCKWYYYSEPDWLGNHLEFIIYTDHEEGEVIGWESQPLLRTRPPSAMKWVGW